MALLKAADSVMYMSVSSNTPLLKSRGVIYHMTSLGDDLIKTLQTNLHQVLISKAEC
jgi:hypothetical protein